MKIRPSVPGYALQYPSSLTTSHPSAPLSVMPVFQGTPASENQKIRAELTRLQCKEALYRNLAQCFLGTLLSPFLAPHKMFSLADIVSDGFQLLKPSQRKAYYQARAEFNVTGKLGALNPLLPTRQRLATTHDQQGLQRYDHLIQEILQKAEFYESGTRAYRKVQEQAHDAWFRKQEHSEKAQDARKVTDTRPKLSLLQDPSMKSLIAGQIAELLYQKPEMAQGALNRSGEPLRFVVAHDVAKAGQLGFYTGLDHTIYLNAPCMYWVQKRCFMAQHEFVHAMSRGKDAGDDLLPLMSTDQKVRYEASRQGIQRIFQQQFGSWWGKIKMKFWLTGQNQAGVLNHGFTNNQEFLAVSLDAFTRYPKEFCKTQPGKDLYQVYREMLGVDPLINP